MGGTLCVVCKKVEKTLLYEGESVTVLLGKLTELREQNAHESERAELKTAIQHARFQRSEAWEAAVETLRAQPERDHSLGLCELCTSHAAFQTSFGDFCSKKASMHVIQQMNALLLNKNIIVPEDLKRELKELKKSLPFKTDRKNLATLKRNGESSPNGHFVKLWEIDDSDDGEVRTRESRRLTATEILKRRRQRLTSAEVVLGRLLQEIIDLQ